MAGADRHAAPAKPSDRTRHYTICVHAATRSTGTDVAGGQARGEVAPDRRRTRL
jgi:hypothetical protein